MSAAGKRRIVHVVLDLHEGGLERVVVELVRHASHSGHKPHVVCLRRAGQLAAELAPTQLTVLARQSRVSMLAPLALSRLLRSLRPSLVHLHSGVWFKGAYASRLAGVRRVVFTDHGRPHPDPIANRTLDGLGALMTDRIVAVSPPLAEYLAARLHVSHRKLRVIPNGILLPKPTTLEDRRLARLALGIPPEALVVGTVGRLDPVKAYDHLINAFAEVKRTSMVHVPLTLLLIGDGPERARLEEVAQHSGVAESIRFLGWRNDAGSMLGLMDLFVLPSDSEGTSLSLLEAMAAGTAVVATAVGGTPHVLGDSGAGLLVPPRELDALVAALSALLGNPNLRREMGAKGRARVEARYSFDSMARAYQDLYAELLAEG